MFQIIEKPCGNKLRIAVSDWATRPGAGCELYLNGLWTHFDTPACTPSHPNLFQSQAEVAKKNQRRFISLEYSGHGQSDGNWDVCDLHDYMRDIRFVLDREYKPEMGRLLLVGHSIGGWMATHIALDMYEKGMGDLVAAVVSIATTHGLTDPNGHVGQLLQQRKYAEQWQNEGRITAPLSGNQYAYHAPFIQSSDDLNLISFKKAAKEVGGETVWEMHPPFPAPLPFPITFIHGEHDEACPPEHLEAFKERAKDSAIRIIRTEAEPAVDNPNKMWKARHGMNRPGDLRIISEVVEEYIQERMVPVSAAPARTLAPQFTAG